MSVFNPLQTALIQQSSEVPGHDLRKAFERKMAKHGDACKEVEVMASSDGHVRSMFGHDLA